MLRPYDRKLVAWIYTCSKMHNSGFLAAFLAVLGVCLLTVGITRGASRQSKSVVELQKGFRRQSRLQALDFDTVTVGPYANYDAQTWYFHPNGMSRDQVVCLDELQDLDVTLLQDAVIYQEVTNQNREEGRLVPWDWNDVIYQQTGDAPVITHEPGYSVDDISSYLQAVEGHLVPWDWDDVIYQDVSQNSEQNANTIPQAVEVLNNSQQACGNHPLSRFEIRAHDRITHHPFMVAFRCGRLVIWFSCISGSSRVLLLLLLLLQQQQQQQQQEEEEEERRRKKAGGAGAGAGDRRAGGTAEVHAEGPIAVEST
eukprot:768548-Hanusia_phi.AAC.1